MGLLTLKYNNGRTVLWLFCFIALNAEGCRLSSLEIFFFLKRRNAMASICCYGRGVNTHTLALWDVCIVTAADEQQHTKAIGAWYTETAGVQRSTTFKWLSHKSVSQTLSHKDQGLSKLPGEPHVIFKHLV